VTVVSEAIVDNFFYRHRDCLPFPIVLVDNGGKPAWLTVGGGMPTLARVLGLSPTTMQIPGELKGIVEKASAGDEVSGIGPKKLKIIRLGGGVAGDEGKLIAGWLLRNFGGFHFGQFVLGKWSIGDNETVAGVAEATVDRRLVGVMTPVSSVGCRTRNVFSSVTGALIWRTRALIC
jgi:hypothetical protein